MGFDLGKYATEKKSEQITNAKKSNGFSLTQYDAEKRGIDARQQALEKLKSITPVVSRNANTVENVDNTRRDNTASPYTTRTAEQMALNPNAIMGNGVNSTREKAKQQSNMIPGEKESFGETVRDTTLSGLSGVGSAYSGFGGYFNELSAKAGQLVGKLIGNEEYGNEWYQESNKIAQDYYNKAEELGQYSEEKSNAAKQGRTGFGRLAVDVGSQGVQMATDAAAALATGGNTLIPLAARSFGGAAYESKDSGASLGKRGLYAAGTAGVEVLTEKMFDGLAGVYGAGMADEIVEETINKMAKTEAGRAALKVAASFAEEGLEEGISGVVNPALQTLYNGNTIRQNYSALEASDVLYDMLVGGIMGGLGGVVEVSRDAVNNNTQNSNVGKSTDTTQNNSENALRNAAVQMQQETTERNEAQVQSDNSNAKRMAATLGIRGEQAFNSMYNEEMSKTTSLSQAFSEFAKVYDATLENKHIDTSGMNDLVVNTAKTAAENDMILTSQRKVFKNAGLERNDAFKSANLNSKDVRVLDAVGKATGTVIRFEENLVDDDGAEVNASYDNGVISISKNSDNPLRDAVSHEVVHRIREVSPAAYRSLARFVTDNMSQYKSDFAEMIIERSGYSSEEGLVTEEKVANAFGTLMSNSKMFDEFAKQNRTAAQKIRDAINDLIIKVKNILNGNSGAKLSREDQYAFSELLAKLNEAEEIMRSALVKTQEYIEGGVASVSESANAYRNDMVVENKNGDPVAMMSESGTMQFSRKTYKEDGQIVLNKWLDKAVRRGDLTRNEANDIIKQMDYFYEITEKYEGKYAPFGAWSNAEVIRGENGKPLMSVVKKNNEYALNLDFSLVCKKRRTLDAVFNEMIERGLIEQLSGDINDGQAQIVKINDIIRKHGFETACTLCFVDAKRFRQAKVADDFVTIWNNTLRGMANGKELGYFNFGGSKLVSGKTVETLKDSEVSFNEINRTMKEYKDGTVENKVARYLKSHPNDRKLLMRGDFMSTNGFVNVEKNAPAIMKLYNSKKGSGGPKRSFPDVQYLSEIISKSNFKKENAYPVGGVRIQSFSDYVARLVFDYIQMIGDLSAKKLPAHAYTKEAMFALQFGLTNVKINMSIIPAVAKDGVAAGLDKNGNYFFADESFGGTEDDIKLAKSLGIKTSGKSRGEIGFELAKMIQKQEGYGKNCGTIFVGVSNEHILKMLDDNDIRMIIPYHKSGLNHIVAVMNNIDKFTDYTDYQNTRYADGTSLSKADKKSEVNFNKRLHELGENGDPRRVANEYLDWCEKNGYLPKFDQFKDHPNYYKLLEDFTVYDESGKYTPQVGVTMNFPTEDSPLKSMEWLINDSLKKDAILEGQRNQEIPGIVDEIAKEMNLENRKMFSRKSTETEGYIKTRSQAEKVSESISHHISKIDGVDYSSASISHGMGSTVTFYEEVYFNDYNGEEIPSIKIRYSGHNNPNSDADVYLWNNKYNSIKEIYDDIDKEISDHVAEWKEIIDRLGNSDNEKDFSRKISAENRQKILDEYGITDAELAAEINAAKKVNRQAVREIKKQKEAVSKREKKISELREERDKKIDALKQKQREKESNLRESRSAIKMREKITRHAKDLSEKLLKPTDKKHIPQELKEPVAELLKSINLESAGGKETKRTERWRNLRDAYDKIVGDNYDTSDIVVDPDLLGSDGIFQSIIDMGDKPIAEMNTDELSLIWKALRGIEGSISSINKAFALGRFQEISEIAEKLKVDNIEKKDRKTLKGFAGGIQKNLTIDNLTPQAFFHRLGSTGDYIFRMMRKAQDKQIMMTKDAEKYTNAVVSDMDINKLEKEMNTVSLGGQDVELSTAQIMELYALTKREQAMNHIVNGGGIHPDHVDTSKGIWVVDKAEPIRGVDLDQIAKIVSMLTKEQKDIVDALQSYMSTEVAEWGNKASMEVYNYEKFLEDIYWPIRTSETETKKDVKEFQAVPSMPNKGFAMQTNEHAKTSIRLGSVFDTYSRHVSDMASYAAWLAVSEDLKRIDNYKFIIEGNTTGTVSGVIDRAIGIGANNYFMKLMTDIARGVKSEAIMHGKITGNYKAAAVGANIRVIVQQPTAILRAFYMIAPKYFVSTDKAMSGWNKALKYAPIAVWKDWGYFDISTGRSMKNILFNSDSKIEKTKNKLMEGASWADSVAWGALWNACERETRATTDLTVGSIEYYNHVADRFSEIVDRTQVVDGILQRSGLMRKGDPYHKMVTAFMGEPTKQYNMLASAIYDFSNAVGKDAKEKAANALKITSFSLLVSGIANAAAQSFVDAMRSDDKDDYWDKWLDEFLENIIDTFNPFSYLPIIKDMFSALTGTSVKRMDMETFYKLGTAASTLTKALQGEGGSQTLANAMANMTFEVARILGIPIATLKRDVLAIITTAAYETHNYVFMYKMEKTMRKIGYDSNRRYFYDILYAAKKNGDMKAYNEIKRDMLKNGFEESAINRNMTNRADDETK